VKPALSLMALLALPLPALLEELVLRRLLAADSLSLTEAWGKRRMSESSESSESSAAPK
jgi:hypothetical protein